MAGEWSETTVGELLDIKHGFAFKGEYFRDEPPGNILLTPGNFAIGGGFKADKFKYYNGAVPEEFVLHEGDLLVTMTDLSKQADTLGYPAFVPAAPAGRRFLHNQRLGKVVVKDERAIDLRYLHYLMRSQAYRHEVLASATGTTVKHTSPERINRFRFMRPPLSEQRAIAHILGTLDDKIELNRRMNETLEAMARAIFKSWFVDFLPVRAKIAAKAEDPLLAVPEAEPGQWYVYALECDDGSVYIGQTENLRQRWQQHLSGKGGRWTKGHPPLCIVWWEKLPSREAAVERENWLKTGFGRKWLKNQIAAIARTQTGDPVRLPAALAAQAGAKADGCQPPGMDPETAALFPNSFQDSPVGKIPKGWDVGIFDETIELIGGGTPKTSVLEYWEGDIPWFSVVDAPAYSDVFVIDTEKKITTLGLEESSARLLPEGATIITARGTVGECALLGVPMAMNQSCYGVRGKHGRGDYFTYFALRAAVSELRRSTHGSVFDTITRGTFKALQATLIPVGLTQVFDERVRPFLAHILANLRESRTLSAIRDALLPKLLSGEIRVKDAEAFLGRQA
ncbi:MAG: restriction endonuclease subunit S [Acidobacteriota bacterium]